MARTPPCRPGSPAPPPRPSFAGAGSAGRRWSCRRAIAGGGRSRPASTECARLARAGLPFQIAAERRYDRSGAPARFSPALAAGKTVFFPQIHQVLPRLARLMAALRASLLGPGRAECSFLFVVQGRGREGLGLHHDGAVDAFWLQLDGRRTVTIGPPVPRGTPEELPDAYASRRGPARAAGWRTLDLASRHAVLPAAPHAAPRALPRPVAGDLADVDPGGACPRGRRRARAVGRRVRPRGPRAAGESHALVDAGAGRRRTARPRPSGFALRLPDGSAIRLPAARRPLRRQLAAMPSWRLPLSRRDRDALAPLIEHGIVAPRDLPLLIAPADPGSLDGWRFG